MDIANIIELLPDSVKVDVIDFTDVKLKSGGTATRITIDRLLTDAEIDVLLGRNCIAGLDCIAQYRYAPEIRKSYFYVCDMHKYMVELTSINTNNWENKVPVEAPDATGAINFVRDANCIAGLDPDSFRYRAILL